MEDETTQPKSLLNKAEVRRTIFELVAFLRPGLKDKMTRVSEATFDYLEDKLREELRRFIRQHPSVGKTITPGGYHAEEK